MLRWRLTTSSGSSEGQPAGYKGFNDVWSSPDGGSLDPGDAGRPWPPRMWFSADVYRRRMWVLGGWSNEPSKNWNDVWHSADGKAWEQLKTKTIWSARAVGLRLPRQALDCGEMPGRWLAMSGTCNCHGGGRRRK